MTRRGLLALLLVLGLIGPAAAEEGVSPGDTSKSTIAQLQLGEYWYGRQIEPADLTGKVVLVVLWGS